MKRFLLLVAAVLAIPATAFAAISGTGGGTSIANGQATLVSNSGDPFSYLEFDDLNGEPVASLDELAADLVSADWGGGSPRFSIAVSDGGATKNIFVYLGDLPNYASGGTGPTGNLLADGLRVDSSQLGGPFYGTWEQAVAAAAGDTIEGISFVVDGDWATGGSQNVVVDSVSINGTIYDFTAAAKSDCKEGNWQYLGFVNQGDCVSSLMSSH